MGWITMVIECINCSRKYNLNEHTLKPSGSNVRCTKCGQIFLAFPIFNYRNERSLPAEKGMDTKEVNSHKAETSPVEQRMDHRIKVSVPASCISTDADGNALDFNIGRITEVSREGLIIEIFCNSSFEFISISFITLEDKEIHMKGKVVRTKRNALGKKKIELSLIGTSSEIADFVLKIVRYNHYTTNPADKFQKAKNPQYFIDGQTSSDLPPENWSRFCERDLA
jgi:predicted Zn finger-like uncharacterized protein